MEKNRNLVYFMEEYFGFTLSSKNLRRCQLKLRENKYSNSSFLMAVSDYMYKSKPFPKRKTAELRPLIGHSFTKNPYESIYYDVSLDGINVEYFKKMLLYYNKVCLTIHTEFFGENFYNIEASINFLNFILSIKPLIENDIIGFVYEPFFYPDTEDLKGYITADIHGCAEFDLDYTTTNSNSWKYLHQINYSSKNKFESQIETILNSSFLNFELPNLKGVPYLELIEIRDNSVAFSDLRLIFEKIMEELVLDKESSLSEIGDKLDYLIKHRFSEQKSILTDEILKSSFLSSFKSNSLNLCLSFAGLLIASKFAQVENKDLIMLASGASGPLAFFPYLIDQIKLKKNKKKTLLNICSYISEKN